MSVGGIQELPYKDEIKVVDMQVDMIAYAYKVAEEALHKHEIDREVACHIKKHFDSKY